MFPLWFEDLRDRVVVEAWIWLEQVFLWVSLVAHCGPFSLFLFP